MIPLTYSKEQLEELRIELHKANKGGNIHQYRVLLALVLIGEKRHGMFVKKNSEHITIERLPSFSPDFNPIEKLWKNTKRDATHLKYFETFEDLHNSVVQAFEGYMNDASKVLCVMKKMREEFSITY